MRGEVRSGLLNKGSNSFTIWIVSAGNFWERDKRGLKIACSFVKGRNIQRYFLFTFLEGNWKKTIKYIYFSCDY